MASKMLGVVDQVRLALKARNRLATFFGFAFGGFIPIAIYTVAHGHGGLYTPGLDRATALVCGGLLYSAQTVYQWARLAFTSAVKSFGFVVLLEGVMVTAEARWLSLAALVYLVAINGIATGCTLSAKRAQ